MELISLSEKIQKICADLEWKSRVQVGDIHTLVICPLPTDLNIAGVLFVISENRVTTYISYKTKLPQKYSHIIYETIAMVNMGLLSGCFEYNIIKNEIRYRDSIMFMNLNVDTKLIEMLLATTLKDATAFIPVIAAISKGNSSDDIMKLIIKG